MQKTKINKDRGVSATFSDISPTLMPHFCSLVLDDSKFRAWLSSANGNQQTAPLDGLLVPYISEISSKDKSLVKEMMMANGLPRWLFDPVSCDAWPL